MILDASKWSGWLGRSEVAEDIVTASRINDLCATLDYSDAPFREGDRIPPGCHRLFFHEVAPASKLRSDGHPEKGEFMPPIPLQRRMWANTRLEFHKPLRVGDKVRRISTIAAIDPKQGRTGPLVFVTTRMEFSVDGGLALVEEQTSVFRSPDKAKGPPRGLRPPPLRPVWTWPIDPSPVLLFRYSALTMNSHRIHYDRRHATEVEGYPGLVVHGSLQTLLLLELVRRECPSRSIANCVVRAGSPVFDTAAFQVQGAPGEDGRSAVVWTLDADGGLAVSARVVFNEAVRGQALPG